MGFSKLSENNMLNLGNKIKTLWIILGTGWALDSSSVGSKKSNSVTIRDRVPKD